MKQTLTTHEAAHQLRQDENANWSFSGALALIEYLEQYEDDAEIELEFDRVAIRCDFSEYASLQDWAKEYHGTEYLLEACEACDIDEGYALAGDDDEIDSGIREYITDRGTLIEFDGGIIVGAF